MICKQLNEIVAIAKIDLSQRISLGKDAATYKPIISDVGITSEGVRGGYILKLKLAGEDFVLGLQRGGPRIFSSIDSAIKVCKLIGIKDMSVSISQCDMFKALFYKDDDCGE